MAKPIVTARILRRLLGSGVYVRAERLLARMHPADLGPLIADLSADEIRTVIDLLFRQHRAAQTLMELPPELLQSVFDAVADSRLAEMLGRLEIDDRLELVEQIPEDRRDGVIEMLPAHVRDELRKAELYPASSAGRVMTTSFIALDEKMTAQEAIDSIRAADETDGTILYLYVIDDMNRLRGVVPIRRLVSAPPDSPCGELTIDVPASVQPEADQEEVARLVARYDLLAIPVTDVDGVMLGVITVDDVIDVITAEATEDMYHLAGLSEEDRVFTSAGLAIRKRLPWMVLNLGAVFALAALIGVFRATIEEFVVLAFFLPVVAGMGGNGGIQTLTVITRGIALGEIEFSTGLRAIAKEFWVGTVIGMVTGLLSAGLAYLWHGSPLLGLILFTAMIVTLAVASLLGAAVPLALKALRQDPALGAGVIVTTLTDAVAFVVFLGTASLLLERI
ncbi:MAG: magnesium transporter [Myxococcota bacterium]